MLKKYLVGTFAVAALALAMTVSAAYDFGTVTLKVGSKGEAVKTLQTLVGVTADGSFGPMTKAAVMKWQAANGLTADGLFGKASMAKANGGAVVVTPGTPSTPVVTGGAGDASLTHYGTGEKGQIAEGQSNVNVLGFKVEATDSDIAVNNVKLEISQVATGSEKITRYIDSVDVYMGSTKVGSVDASDFTRTSGSPDIYSKSVALTGAVVKEGDKNAFSVKLNAIDSIDADDEAFSLKVEVVSYRFVDGSGVVTSDDSLTDMDVTVELDSNNDGADVKSSTSNPDDTTVGVDATDTTDDVLALAFKIKADTDSSDITITELPIDLSIASAGAGKASEDVIDTVTVKIDGDSYEAELVGSDSTSPIYSVDLTDEDVVISDGDTMEVKVYLSFQGQDGNYAENTIVTASVDAADISAETSNDDTFTITGTDQTGAALTLNTNAAEISGMKWVVSSTGSIVDFFFTVKADTADFDVLSSSITATTAGTATASALTLSKSTGDATAISGGFTVAEGDTATFRVRYDITGTNGTWKEITITSVAGKVVADDTQVSPTATRNVAN